MNRIAGSRRHAGAPSAHTVGELLDLASLELRAVCGDDASLEAQVLLAQALGIDRSRLLASIGDRVPRAAAGAFEAFVSRRVAREPLAYIVGRREFYGIDIMCSPAALIPRPETEMLVGLALEEIERRAPDARVCDVGTGSGAIAVAIAAHAPHTRVVAIDPSADALQLARENALRHRVAGRIDFVRTDLCAGLGMFDVVVANLPYVSEDEWRTLEPELRDHEPRSALVGGTTGTEIIERLLRAAPAHLCERGVLAVEIGATQADRVITVARQAFPGARIELMRDFAGLDRMVSIHT
jgi:release factor glutamine methyltransferase